MRGLVLPSTMTGSLRVWGFGSLRLRTWLYAECLQPYLFQVPRLGGPLCTEGAAEAGPHCGIRGDVKIPARDCSRMNKIRLLCWSCPVC
jgi:hypothetical protein